VTEEPRQLGPVQIKIARALAQRHDRGDPELWYWETAANIARLTGIPLRRVRHHLYGFARDGLVDRHEDDGYVAYRMRQEFAATVYHHVSCM
jgi:DNA-binding transcriptional ArsR family regulator